ncbi:molecular chaperone DnaK (HSP70) [Desulfosalsimonas propionicica]|uniref:Molecular chaperone DnaK (HSP70) n=1 Tax=Desulfosalsimonas propionicica TaxID=332175 RepID=A0A7W0CA52_9BACT|nr:Hsp70 family protein [Desulfosalsimonas propionicica]MBA2881984.1 molecular chaperone DnaK (HSP70) [Desulfosalsimonas propionicica]
MTEKKIKRIFGIDLGTTYSSIAYVDEYGKAVIIPNAENERVTPSVVFFDENTVVVGEVAKESAKLYPNEVVSFIKRSMGEPNFIFEYGGERYRPEEISAYVLKKLAQDAQQHLGETISDVVITCPAYFGINEREATRKAGEIAGFNVRQIINEPTAAAIAYGSLDTTQNRVVLVYDLGGGTFDVTMIDIRKESVEVICTGGDHNLGGKDWDDRIVAFLVEKFQEETGITEDILDDPDTWQDLQLSAEKAKKILSQRPKTPVSITHGGKRVKLMLEREKFEEVTEDLLVRTVDFTRDMLDAALQKGYSRFDEIILVGGATRMPQVSERIEKEFDMAPKVFDPDEAVAKGAAIYGWKLALNDDLIRRISEKTQKTFDASGNLSEMMDTSQITTRDFQEAARELAEDTGYALPSVENAMLRVKNVTSKSFGVVAHNPSGEEIVFNLVLRNTTVPVNVVKKFYTAVQNQKTVLIRTMESETSSIEIPLEHATEIKTAVLHLPPNLPADLPIEITFDLNDEGRLHITALETGEYRKVQVEVDTASVIGGEEFEKAKQRSQNLVVH